MTIARSAADVLNGHVALELECKDRLYVNAYVPMLQSGAGASFYFRELRGFPVPSSALMAQMTRSFVASIERFVRDEGLDVFSLCRGERKDARTQERLSKWDGSEGVLYVGKAQERARVRRTERRQNPVSGAGYPWLVSRTAMVDQYHFYLFDADFGPLFVKFCSCFPYNAKLCLNGHEYLKRQLKKQGIGFEDLDNGILRCADADAMQAVAREITLSKIDAQFRKWMARLPADLQPALRGLRKLLAAANRCPAARLRSRRIPPQPCHIRPAPTANAWPHRTRSEDKPMPRNPDRPTNSPVLLPSPPPRPRAGTVRPARQDTAHRSRPHRRTLRPPNRSAQARPKTSGLKCLPDQNLSQL